MPRNPRRNERIDHLIQTQILNTPCLISMTQEEYDRMVLTMLSKLMGKEASDPTVKEKLAELRVKYPYGAGSSLVPDMDELIEEMFSRECPPKDPE